MDALCMGLLVSLTYRCCNAVIGLRLCLGAFQTSPVDSLYVDAHEPSLGARREKLYLQYATKIMSLPNLPAHNAVFDNTYMKLFDARPSAIRTFGLRIKQFLTTSNIELSDILETPSYFILPPPKIVLNLVHLKKDGTDASVYQQLFIGIRDRYRDYIPVYKDGLRDGNTVACATGFPSNTVISKFIFIQPCRTTRTSTTQFHSVLVFSL